MAVAKIILFDVPSKQLSDGRFPIVLRVTHQRKRKYFSLNKYCFAEQWNKTNSVLYTKSEATKINGAKEYKGAKKENDALDSILEDAKNIIRDFERYKKPFSLSAFEKTFLKSTASLDLEERFQTIIDNLEDAGKISTASPYKTTLNAIKEFTKAVSGYTFKGLELTDITFSFLKDFEKYLKTKRGVKDTSIIVYMRTLRAAMNHAIKEGVLKREYYPFYEYKISELDNSTDKRAIKKEYVKKIKALTFDDNTPEKFAQDIFLFSYYTRGMNFIDIAYLTPENIVNERIRYKRKKTRGKTKEPQIFDMAILPPVQKILDYYIENKVTNDDFIFPIFDESIHKTPKQKYNRRKTALKKVNKYLKGIGEMVGLENIKLTTYVSRHSYANVLKDSNVPISIISENMGHHNVEVTQIYLKQFENKTLDEADKNLL